MPLSGVYEPSPSQRVRDQVEQYERSGGTEATTMKGVPVVILTTLGATSGLIRKNPLMRVEHQGTYALVASDRGAPADPQWYRNAIANPQVELQDGPLRRDMTVREAHGGEKALWWERAVAVFAEYADYQAASERLIPVLLVEPAPAG